jgi:hypothetical protein
MVASEVPGSRKGARSASLRSPWPARTWQGDSVASTGPARPAYPLRAPERRRPPGYAHAMSSGTTRTPEQRRLATRHVGYEVERCVACAVVLRAGGVGAVLRDALLEAHLIHARNALEFLAPKDPRPDDVVASDLVREDAPWDPGLPDDLKRVISAIGKHLAHLTWVRVTHPEPVWTPLELAQDVLDLASSWSEHLDPDLATDIEPFLARSARRLRGAGPGVTFSTTTGSGPPF